ncbi:MAG: hypothetical protein ACLU37_12400 [Collinsella sp.]
MPRPRSLLKEGDLKDGRAFVIGRGGELFACGIARYERDLGTRDGRILVGDVDHDHTKHGAREHQDLEGIIFVGVCLGGANGNMKAFALPGTRGNIMLASEDAPATSNERRSSIFGSHPAGIGGNNPILREGILSR